jgi:hypothetical protein
LVERIIKIFQRINLCNTTKHMEGGKPFNFTSAFHTREKNFQFVKEKPGKL